MTALSDEIDAMIAEHGGRVRDALNIAMAQRDSLRAELADVRAQWQADVGSAIARAQTAEDAARRAEQERAFMMRKYYDIKRCNAQRRDAARNVAKAYRKLDAENSRWIGIVSGVLHERDAARAEAARLTERVNKSAHALELWAHDADQFSQRAPNGDALISDDDLIAVKIIAAALLGPAQSEQPAARRQEANDEQH